MLNVDERVRSWNLGPLACLYGSSQRLIVVEPSFNGSFIRSVYGTGFKRTVSWMKAMPRNYAMLYSVHTALYGNCQFHNSWK
jgi:hypothetical protein